VISTVAGKGFGADAASSREVDIAIENGIDSKNIYYSTPGKTISEIEHVFGRCVIIADSFSEIKRINLVAKKHGKIEKIGIRINPDFTMDDDNLSPSKFGIDIEQLDDFETFLQQYPNVSVSGIHIHIRSQVLDFEKLGRYYKKSFEIAKRLNKVCKTIEFINFGSGIGTVYDKVKESPLDLQKLAQLTEIITANNNETLNARLILETGRFIVCSAGTYYTKIVDIKESRGTKYLIVKNGMNGFLRPAIANLLNRTAGGNDIPGQEPLYTSMHAFSVSVLNDEIEKERVSIVGNLCTARDVLVENVEVNKAEIGDVVSVSNAGSYGYSLSPVLFSSHDAPAQLYLKEDGSF
jgi:diaminopimelate decarboxylase